MSELVKIGKRLDNLLNHVINDPKQIWVMDNLDLIFRDTIKFESLLNERALTSSELKAKEEEFKKLKANKKNFVKRYGKDAEKIMHAIAVKRAKQQNESLYKSKIKEIIRSIIKPETKD